MNGQQRDHSKARQAYRVRRGAAPLVRIGPPCRTAMRGTAGNRVRGFRPAMGRCAGDGARPGLLLRIVVRRWMARMQANLARAGATEWLS